MSPCILFCSFDYDVKNRYQNLVWSKVTYLMNRFNTKDIDILIEIIIIFAIICRKKCVSVVEY